MNIYSPSLKYYVYAYLRKSNGKPYYIGKGCGLRAYQPHKKISVPKDRERIVFLERALTEVGAYALERRYIEWYGKTYNKTGILLNIMDGGEGCDVSKFNDPMFKNSDSEKIRTSKISSYMKEQWNNFDSVFNKKERNEKISETLRNKWKDPNSEYNRDNNRDKRQKLSQEKWGKTFIIYSPEGVEHKIKGIRKFCRDHNLIYQSMTKVIKGTQKTHKGWTGKELKNE